MLPRPVNIFVVLYNFISQNYFYKERSCWNVVCSRNGMNMNSPLTKTRFLVGGMHQNNFNEF